VLSMGMSCTIRIKRPSASLASTVTDIAVPQYDLCLEDIDNLVAIVFKVVSVNPNIFTGRLNKTARRWLEEDNCESRLSGC